MTVTDVINWNRLTPDERNRIVAEKVMGWQEKECEGQWIGYGYDYGMKWEDDNYYICNACGEKTYRSIGGEHKQDLILPYSTDMNAAMKIVERFKGGDWHDFCQELVRLATGKSLDAVLWYLSAEAICVASLRVQGIEVNI